MTKKINIAVIFGGRSGEHDVSLMSARSVLSVLSPEKYEVTQVGITRAGTWLTGKNVIEAFESEAFEHLTPVVLVAEPRESSLFWSKAINSNPAPHGCLLPNAAWHLREDGTLQGLLELADVAYVGCGVLASSAGMDKGLFKDIMRANNIPVVESVITTREEISASTDAVISRIESLFPYPVFVKPANLGSSVGISKCSSRANLVEGLMDAARYDRRVLVERGVNAREIEVSVLGNEDPAASVAVRSVPWTISTPTRPIHPRQFRIDHPGPD
jgi:D-alanine-D-alanine ligase